MTIKRNCKAQLLKRLQGYIKELPEYAKSQIRYCGWRSGEEFSANEKIYLTDSMGMHRGIYFTGYQTCGTIFCPSCSGLIKTYRAHELNTFCNSFNGNIYLFTFTISHVITDRLNFLFDVLKNSYRRFWNNSVTKKLVGSVDGTVRSLEVTHGNNGWHPHYHTLVFVPESVSFSDDSICKFKNTWSRMVLKSAGSADPEIGLDIKCGDHAASYICKLGSELNGQECKDSCDFLQLLVDRKKSLVQEYLVALKGVHWLEWSKGLRSRFSLPDVTDSEIVQRGLFFRKRKLDISQLTLNFLQDGFFNLDQDGKGRDYLVDLLKMHSKKQFVDGPKIQQAFSDYCNLNLRKNRRFTPDPDQFLRDMVALGFDPNDFI